MVLIARDVAKKIEEELEYPGQIKVHIIRENRAIDLPNKVCKFTLTSTACMGFLFLCRR
jgi:hypothetical protein